jgi:hypothetical protein
MSRLENQILKPHEMDMDQEFTPIVAKKEKAVA